MKRCLNIESVFSPGAKYPALHRSIERFPLEEIDFTGEVRPGLCVAVGLDEVDPEQFYFDRFVSVLRRNGVETRRVDLRRADFATRLSGCDCLLFRPCPRPYRLDVLRDVVRFVETGLELPVFPGCHEIQIYENKRLQHWFLGNLGFPVIPTFISADFQESLLYLSENPPPYIFKANVGAKGSGVERLGDRKTAERYVRRIFSANGATSPWAYSRLKNTVHIQPFIENKGYDLRVAVVGDQVMGYYRRVQGKDFRASGSGVLEFGPLPAEAVRIAVDVRNRLDLTFVAVDFIEDLEGKLWIVEISTFIGHRTSGLYREGGVPGWLRVSGDGRAEAELGKRCWFPDLMVEAFLTRHFPRGDE
ncbi:MAG: hypothetical protein JJU00_20315 [Opitutales bacterium]|nr:hypothetical protein [Opitutales bacterium]